MEEDGSTNGSEEEEYEASDFSDEEDDDADDTSWKVRRAAVKLLRAIILARPDLNAVMYEVCSAGLLRRFKERAEQVRMDVIVCYTALLENTAVHAQGQSASASAATTTGAGATGALPSLTRGNSAGAPSAPALLQRADSSQGATSTTTRSHSHGSSAQLSKGHSLLIDQMDDVIDAGKSKPKFKVEGSVCLFLYTGGVLFHAECCIRLLALVFFHHTL